MALSGTFLLSALPQTVEAVCVAASGKIDTHVLMSLAVIGTLLLGMAQEVREKRTLPLSNTCPRQLPPGYCSRQMHIGYSHA
jgi:hypothetical protein